MKSLGTKVFQLKSFSKKWLLPPGVAEAFVKLFNGHEQPSPNETDDIRFVVESNRGVEGRHRGERCFILGAGPSVKVQDLTKLKGEYVISVSNTFVHADYPLFRPSYHVLPHILKGHGSLSGEDEFACWLKEMEEKTFDAELFLHVGDRLLVDKYNLFNGRVIHWNEYVSWDGSCPGKIDLTKVPSIWSVSEYALTVAIYLGFDEIYLIGFDHDWFNGVFNYFYDEKKEHALRPEAKKIPHVDSEFQMRRHADIFKKYKCLKKINSNIFNVNSTPNHYLDVFEKVDYDSLF